LRGEQRFAARRHVEDRLLQRGDCIPPRQKRTNSIGGFPGALTPDTTGIRVAGAMAGKEEDAPTVMRKVCEFANRNGGTILN
jgi:hypothetical protein